MRTIRRLFILLAWPVLVYAQQTNVKVCSQTNPSQCANVVNGALQISGAGGGGTSSSFGASFPASGTAAGFKDPSNNMAGGNVDASGNLKVNVAAGSAAGVAAFEQPGGTDQEARVYDSDTGAGTEWTAGLILRLPASGGSVLFGTSTDPIRTDPTGSTPQPVSGTIAVSNSFLLDTTFTNRINTLGQKTMANSTPVVLSSDQSSIPATVSGTVTSNIGTTGGLLLDSTFTSRTPAALDADGGFKVHLMNGSGGGTSSSFGSAFPGTGTAAGFISSGGNMAGGNLDVDGNLKVNVAAGSAAGVAAYEQPGGTDQEARVYDTDSGGGSEWTAGMNLRISENGGSIEAKGQKTMAGSIPVVLPSDQAVDVSDAFLLDTTFTGRINTFGQKTMANSTPVVISSDQSAISVTASGTVTSNIGTTGGLMLDTTFTGRINTQGQKTMSASTPIVIASDQSAVPVNIGTFPDNEPFNVAQWGGTNIVNGGVAGTVAVGGTATHAVAVSGNPVQIGSYAESEAAALDSASVAEGDISREKVDIEGRKLVRMDHPFTWFCTRDAQSASGVCQASVASGYTIDLVELTNGPTAQNIKVVYGTGTTCGTGTTVIVPTTYLGVNGGAVIPMHMSPHRFTGTVDVCCIISGSTAHSCMIRGHRGP